MIIPAAIDNELTIYLYNQSFYFLLLLEINAETTYRYTYSIVPKKQKSKPKIGQNSIAVQRLCACVYAFGKA